MGVIHRSSKTLELVIKNQRHEATLNHARHSNILANDQLLWSVSIGTRSVHNYCMWGYQRSRWLGQQERYLRVRPGTTPKILSREWKILGNPIRCEWSIHHQSQL